MQIILSQIRGRETRIYDTFSVLAMMTVLEGSADGGGGGTVTKTVSQTVTGVTAADSGTLDVKRLGAFEAALCWGALYHLHSIGLFCFLLGLF